MARPTKPPEQTMQVVPCRVSIETKQKILDIAAKKQWSESQTARVLIEKGLEVAQLAAA